MRGGESGYTLTLRRPWRNTKFESGTRRKRTQRCFGNLSRGRCGNCRRRIIRRNKWKARSRRFLEWIANWLRMGRTSWRRHETTQRVLGKLQAAEDGAKEKRCLAGTHGRGGRIPCSIREGMPPKFARFLCIRIGHEKAWEAGSFQRAKTRRKQRASRDTKWVRR